MILRFFGMAISWVAFSFSFALVYFSMRAVMAVGGQCADGGPYVIAVHCPAGVEWLLPGGIWLGLLSVGAYVFLAKGLGAALTAWAWPVLFIGLGWNFLEAGIFGGDPIGWVLGIMFVVMGAVPLVLTLRAPGGPRSLIVGTSTVRGETVAAASHVVSQVQARFAQPSWQATEDDPRFTGTDYLVLVPLWVVEVLLGYWLALLLLGL